MKLAIINGPNLNLLGKREPEIYGSASFEDYFAELQAAYPQVEFVYFQSNIEGELVSSIQKYGFEFDGLILNAAAYTHTSVAISDAVASVPATVIEVHISNIYSREEYRHKSIISAHCKGMISGLGLKGYKLAIQYFVNP
jgi:3-dehydroquinate dehydratase-2